MLRLLKIFFLIYAVTPICLGSDNLILNPTPNEDTTIQTYDGTSLLEHIRTSASNKTTEIPLGVTSSNSVSTDQVIESGKTLFKPNYILPGSSTLTLNGTLVTTGAASGTGTIQGTGSIISADGGQNGDDIEFSGNTSFTGNVVINGKSIQEATHTTLGLVKKNAWVQKNLPASLEGSALNTDIFTFNNLDIGKTYKVEFKLNLTFPNPTADTFGDFRITHDGVDLSLLVLAPDVALATATHRASYHGFAVFVATASTVTVNGNNWSGTDPDLTSGNQSFAILYERNDLGSQTNKYN